MINVLESSKASSFGFKQRNSLLHNNEIIDSSIVINIIINGKYENKTTTTIAPQTFAPEKPGFDLLTTAPYEDLPQVEDLQSMDRYNRPLMPLTQAKDSDYQEIGGGRLKIEDGYRRPLKIGTTADAS